MAIRVLVVDDEAPLLDLVCGYLAREGWQTETASDGPAGVAAARAWHPDLVVLDLNLPELDGVEVCRQLRTFSDAYVLMLTARAEEVDKLVGLAVGADDYMTKPFSPRELVARLKVLLRRPRAALAPIGPAGLRLDVPRREVAVDGRPVELTATGFGLLATLARDPGVVVSRQALLVSKRVKASPSLSTSFASGPPAAWRGRAIRPRCFGPNGVHSGTVAGRYWTVNRRQAANAMEDSTMGLAPTVAADSRDTIRPAVERRFEALVAVDGSEPAEGTLQLVAGSRWPAGTRIRVLTVVETRPVDSGVPVELAADESERLRRTLAAAEGVLAVEIEVRIGRPATEILRVAEECHAGLVVVGSRGHGTIAAALLGSVSAEVVDHAPCAVLVARGDRVRRLLIADDGSPDARHAVDYLLDHGLFPGTECRVIGVAQALPIMHTGIAPTLYREAIRAQTEELDASVASLRRVTADTAARLEAAGLPARPEVVVGSPAARIVELAATWADLVVVGSHGRTGLRRLALGSVSRSVLSHAASSVLVVRSADREPHAADLTA